MSEQKRLDRPISPMSADLEYPCDVPKEKRIPELREKAISIAKEVLHDHAYYRQWDDRARFYLHLVESRFILLAINARGVKLCLGKLHLLYSVWQSLLYQFFFQSSSRIFLKLSDALQLGGR